jgi:hypothetical protein
VSARAGLEAGDDYGRHITLLDLVDRLLDTGVVLQGDITLAIADVDLVYVGLRAMISSVDALERAGGRPPA